MMETIREYLVSVVAVCMITVPAMVFIKKESLQRIVKLVGGVLILIVAIRPLLHLDMDVLSDRLEEFTQKYEFDSATVEETVQSKMAEYVAESSAKVIEEKAQELGGILQAKVTVSDGELPVPTHVKLTGTMSLQAIEQMKDFLQTAFQLPPEEQEWELYGATE